MLSEFINFLPVRHLSFEIDNLCGKVNPTFAYCYVICILGNLRRGRKEIEVERLDLNISIYLLRIFLLSICKYIFLSITGKRVREAVKRIDVGGKLLTNHLKVRNMYRYLNHYLP